MDVVSHENIGAKNVVVPYFGPLFRPFYFGRPLFRPFALFRSISLSIFSHIVFAAIEADMNDGVCLYQATPSQTVRARLTRSIVSSSRRPNTSPIFSRFIDTILSTMICDT